MNIFNRINSVASCLLDDRQFNIGLKRRDGLKSTEYLITPFSASFNEHNQAYNCCNYFPGSK